MRVHIGIRPGPRFMVWIVVAVLCLVGEVCSPPAGGSARGVPVADDIHGDIHGSGLQVKTATIALGNCKGPNVRIRVAIARRIYVPSQPVDVVAVVHN